VSDLCSGVGFLTPYGGRRGIVTPKELSEAGVTRVVMPSDNLTACPNCGTVHPCMEELIEELVETVNQATRMPDGTLDSMATTAYAESMRLLARLGRLDIDREYGRRVIGRWKDGNNAPR